MSISAAEFTINDYSKEIVDAMVDVVLWVLEYRGAEENGDATD